MKKLMTSIVFALALFGCDKTEEPQPDPSAEAPAAPATEKKEPVEEEVALTGPDLAPEEPTTELGEHPVPADLEEEADKLVVMDNFEAELDRLEAEIDG